MVVQAVENNNGSATNNRAGLIWFRSDLRVVDNTALIAATRDCKNILAVFVSTPLQWRDHDVAPIKADFIRRRLVVLRQQLSELNIPLVIIEVDDFEKAAQAVTDLSVSHNISQVYCNKQYEWNECQRDEMTAAQLGNHNIRFSSFDDDCIIAPGKVLTRNRQPFRVFTPFRREWLKVFLLETPTVQITPEKLQANSFVDNAQPEHTVSFTYPLEDSVRWTVDEETIKQRLRLFCQEKAAAYHQQRDIPSVDGTSCLSPYLCVGALSARQCMAALLAEFPQCLDEPNSGAFSWLNEIIWREFYRHLIVAWPKLSREQPFLDWTRHVAWDQSESMLTAWQQGKTGYPIVDAAMRQLKQTGWMHNRLRMITASFLTKDLLIHWQRGEQWFMSQLIDGDLASNNGGWQWAASTGTDAQPYFRVFNPTVQGERFDPDGRFIRTWIHELRDVPDKYIHQPSLWDKADTLNYPKPIVDHKTARIRAIEVFKTAKSLMDEAQ
ncbi:deoxyribodipyrimidine photo-lyase [Photobacterium sp. OFAV2-7]|uniref:deoxyribodipyrimidine photo-lyase n=1 Tax=Photobacterium sp. OFAV2-7 TaxID=2917748 RepID=UPI001EF660DA|nr:deoxyribodipyrimidine photo-lyase [Photobacterium sp. OFAV2-7]MCG7586145.1 deoxyribodipyrimidine photo-lyase [Photobacterium sp. OFAV2-7]